MVHLMPKVARLYFCFFYRFFYHGIQHKNAKQEIRGDKRLPLGLCSFALEKLRLENEKEKYVTHMKP